MVESAKPPPGESQDSSSVTNTSKLQQAVKAIANEVSLLHELSNTIRRASRDSANLKAAVDFCIKDQEGNDLEPALKHYFSVNIKDRFPGCSDVLLDRLASTMVLRRKRILYRRHRYGKTPVRRIEPVSQPEITDHNVPHVGTIHIPDGGLQESGRIGGQAVAATAQTVMKSVAKSATTLAAAQFHQASSPSVVSGAKTIALGTHESLNFPRPPRRHIREHVERLRKTLLERIDEAELQERDTEAANTDGIPDETQRESNRDSEALKKERVEEELRRQCDEIDIDVTCPFCLYTMPSRDLCDEVRWR